MKINKKKTLNFGGKCDIIIAKHLSFVNQTDRFRFSGKVTAIISGFCENDANSFAREVN